MKINSKWLGLAASGVVAISALGYLSSDTIKSQFDQVLGAPVEDQDPTQVKAFPYDGKKLYAEAFELILNHHLALGSKDKSAEFRKEWEHKYDGTDVLDTEKGADHAIDMMLLSQGLLFDQFMRPADVKELKKEADPSFGGIGAKVVIKGKVEAVQEIQRRRPVGSSPDSPEGIAWMAEAQKVFNEYSEITKDRPLIIAVEPEAGTPAHAAGLHKGDALLAIKIDNEWDSFVGDDAAEAVEHLQGIPGTEIELKVQHFDPATGALSPDETVVSMKRGSLVKKVVAFKTLEECMSYIELADFESQYGRQEFKDALDKAIDHAKSCNGKGGAVLSLRQNGGGQLETSFAVESMLMDSGIALVKHDRVKQGLDFETFTLTPDFLIATESSDYRPDISTVTKRRNAFVANGQKDNLEDGDIFSKTVLPASFKLVVIIDGDSASASEIVAGSLQARKRATLIGTTSFGKNVGQTIYALRYGGRDEEGHAIRMLRLTTFEFLPGGNAMKGTGIIPDVEVPLVPAAVGEDSVYDSQVKASMEEIHRQWSADEDREKRRLEAVEAQKKVHDKLFDQKKQFYEKE